MTLVSLNSFLDFFILLLTTTLSQLVWLLGLIFIFGLTLYFFARSTRLTFVKSVGQKTDIFFTGWIGVPVHELGHAVFCLLFLHKITKMKLFSPNSADGSLGSVNHTYNTRSTYQRIGNFFIGIGPILFGSVVIYFASVLLLPDMRNVFAAIGSDSDAYVKILSSRFADVMPAFFYTILNMFGSLFRAENFSDYRFWIFLYIALSISSHMQLSPPDIKGAKGGLISIVVFFLVLNAIILGLEATGISSYFGNFWQYVKLESYAGSINKFLGLMASLFVFATIISGLNFFVSYVVLSGYNLLRGRGFINFLSS